MTLTVMVVDDSASIRIQAGRALSQCGFEIVEAVDGLDALEKFAAAASIASSAEPSTDSGASPQRKSASTS